MGEVTLQAVTRPARNRMPYLLFALSTEICQRSAQSRRQTHPDLTVCDCLTTGKGHSAVTVLMVGHSGINRQWKMSANYISTFGMVIEHTDAAQNVKGNTSPSQCEDYRLQFLNIHSHHSNGVNQFKLLFFKWDKQLERKGHRLLHLPQNTKSLYSRFTLSTWDRCERG